MMMVGGEHPYNNYSTYPFNHPRFQHELGGDGISWKGTSKGNISVGSDVWIGFGVTILSGVTIGDGAVIGAKTLVTKNVEPFSIIAGNPAKLIKYRFSESIRELMHRLLWWNLDNDSIKEISMNLFQSVPTEEALSSLIAKFNR
jgi:acetyltransferase-like isoleucine patch superfamily enzyme